MSLKNKLAAATLILGSVVSPGAMAGGESDDEANDRQSYSAPEPVSPIVQRGWQKAKIRSNNIENNYNNGGEARVPKSLGRVIEENVLKGRPLDYKSTGYMVYKFRKKGLVSTFVGAVVDPNDLDGSRKFVEDVRRMAVSSHIENAKHGGSISAVFRVIHNGVGQKATPGTVLVFMGNTPMVIFSDIEVAREEIEDMFKRGWHTTPYADFKDEILARHADMDNASASAEPH